VATETTVNIGQSVRAPSVYQIIAKPDRVDFYINGTRVASHTGAIPTAALNIYFATGDSGFGNVPVVVDYMSFEQVR
jgi:hypothetical protein